MTPSTEPTVATRMMGAAGVSATAQIQAAITISFIQCRIDIGATPKCWRSLAVSAYRTLASVTSEYPEDRRRPLASRAEHS
ncbi:MAG: hypothetical protein ACYC61_25575 [Isosphaeraceae bacterium]